MQVLRFGQSAVYRADNISPYSKSLASMLPSLISTGLVTLIACAVMRLVWQGYSDDFFGAWIEAWLISWPIAFPVAYLFKPFIAKMSHAVVSTATATRQHTNPGWADLNQASPTINRRQTHFICRETAHIY